MRCLDDGHPILGAEFVAGELTSDSGVEYLRRRPRHRVQPRRLQLKDVVAVGHLGLLRPVPDLERRKSVDMEVGNVSLDRPDDPSVVAPIEIRVEAALDTDLGPAPLFGFKGASRDLIQIEHFSALIIAALRETAERAAHVADIGKVDVAANHEARAIVMHLSTKRIGGSKERVSIRTRRLEQADGVRRRNLSAEEGTLQDTGDLGRRPAELRID